MQHDEQHRSEKRHNITCLQYYAHRLSVRESFSPIFYGGKLFQQYVVDAYIRVEAGRLQYIRTKQNDLRVELYQGLMDHINTQTETRNLQPGKIVVLPSSFQGSPRAMQQNYQDAMAIVAKFGKPDLFLTFTCNPKCQDVQKALLPGQQAQDRPGIVARVFQQHLRELMMDIRKKHVLGKPVAHIYVIEFQKRGLPHCHLLIILADNSKLREPADIDSIISAEIPDPTQHPELFQVIKTTMVHGPCGLLNKHAPCMLDDKCTKDYPKEFRETTALATDGYPLYKRSDNGRTITIGRHQVDNRWIVPYNTYLSQKYQAHINLEACTTIKSVKYLFKYVYKGHDCANIQVTETNQLHHDEVATFIDARYISAPEAYWRMAEYKMHHQSHAIIRLALHLPSQQPVYFTPGNHIAAAEASTNKDTMLTAFFKLNIQQPTDLCYHQLPNHYVFNKSTQEWRPRQRGAETTIGRMYSVSPKDMERYCLRLLLLHVPGPTSFEDLRTVDGQVSDTFKEACIRRHLLIDDTEWDKALSEATLLQMPQQLRSLFTTICIYCDPTNPQQLWEKHQNAMIEDYTHRQYSTHIATQLALQDINRSLQQNGTSLSALGLPDVNPLDIEHLPSEDIDIAAETEKAQTQLMRLNEDQRTLVDQVLQDLDSRS